MQVGLVLGLVVSGSSLVNHRQGCANGNRQPLREAVTLLARSSPTFRALCAQRPQCDVPSERVILFQTLYLPTGLFMGRRLTSFSVCASNTMMAPSPSHTLTSA